MNGTHDTEQTVAADARELDPQQAAMLLEHIRRHAKHQLDASSPLLSLAASVVVLAAYGAIWLSVRGQHPYKGPSGGALAVVLVLVLAVVALTAAVVERATSGVSGHSPRQRRIGIAALVAGYVGVFVLEGALAHDGASHAIAYGVFAAAAPLLVVGSVAIATSAVDADWSMLGLGVMLVATAAGSAFAGPVGVWEAAGLAGCAAFLLRAGAQVWLRRR
jgi:hypothetical protein